MQAMKEEKKKNKSIFYVVLLLVASLFIIKTYFLEMWIVAGDSMNDTYKGGEMVWVYKHNYDIERFDIVICERPDNSFEQIVKRVIGMPNETIVIRGGYIFIDDVLLEESLVEVTTYAGIAEKEIVLGEDEYFVLGDNRENSIDSRDFGPIKKNKIVGVVIK